MANDLIEDIRRDAGLRRNAGRMLLFLVLLFSLDYLVSCVLQKGVERYYGLGSDAEILMVGHSHLMLGIDKVQLERRLGTKVAKYTREGVNVADREVMLRHYFMGQSGRCRLVVYGIDPWIFTGEGLSANSYTLFYPFMDNPEVDRYVHAHARDRFDYYLHKWFRSSRYNVLLINAALRGYLGNWSNLKIGRLDTLALKKEIGTGNYRRIGIDEENVGRFTETLDFLNEKQVAVILLNTPVFHALTEVQKAEQEKVFSLIQRLASRNRNIRFVDLSKGFDHRAELFFDPIHMNPEGQRELTDAFSVFVDSMQVLRKR